MLNGEIMSAEVCWPPPVWAMGFKGTQQLSEDTSAPADWGLVDLILQL